MKDGIDDMRLKSRPCFDLWNTVPRLLLSRRGNNPSQIMSEIVEESKIKPGLERWLNMALYLYPLPEVLIDIFTCVNIRVYLDIAGR